MALENVYEDALKAAHARFALEPFTVRQIHVVGQVRHVTRPIQPYRRAS
jgi:hypothetical protein